MSTRGTGGALSRSRILLVIEEINCGGAEMSFFALCRSLSSRCEAHLALSRHSLENPTIRRLTESLGDTSITVHPCGTLNAGTLANLHPRLRQRPAGELAELIRRVRPDAVLVNLPSVERGQAVIDAAELSDPRIPVWGFLHSSNPPSVIGAKLGWLRDLMVPALLRRFDQLLTVSASGARTVSQRYRAGSPVILHPPIVIPSGLSPVERTKARIAAGLPDEFLLGIVGRVRARHKGQDTAVRVASRLRAEGHPVHLVVIGDGPDIPGLRRLAKELRVAEHVSFLGWREDADQLVPLLSAALIASRHEGMPLTAMQAAAVAVPVVGYSVDGLAEFLPLPFRVPFGDEAGLTDTIAALIEGSLDWPADAMRVLAQSWADPERAAERVLHLLSRTNLVDGQPELGRNQPVAPGEFEGGRGTTEFLRR